jgi:hypothetical protein
MGAGALVKTTLKGANIGDAFNVISGISDYKDAREEGNSKAMSVAKAAGSFVWGEMVFGGASAAIEKGLAKTALSAGTKTALGIAGNVGFMLAYTAVTGGAQVMSIAGQHTASTMGQQYRNKGKLGSGYFNMTEAGYTMRQRSLNAIRQNGLNTQSALGNEARTYYRG